MFPQTAGLTSLGPEPTRRDGNPKIEALAGGRNRDARAQPTGKVSRKQTHRLTNALPAESPRHPWRPDGAPQKLARENANKTATTQPSQTEPGAAGDSCSVHEFDYTRGLCESESSLGEWREQTARDLGGVLLWNACEGRFRTACGRRFDVCFTNDVEPPSAQVVASRLDAEFISRRFERGTIEPGPRPVHLSVPYGHTPIYQARQAPGRER